MSRSVRRAFLRLAEDESHQETNTSRTFRFWCCSFTPTGSGSTAASVVFPQQEQNPFAAVGLFSAVDGYEWGPMVQLSNSDFTVGPQLHHSWGGGGHPAISQKILSVYKVNLSHMATENNHQVASDLLTEDVGARQTLCYATVKRWHVNHRRREKEEELTEMLKQV